MSDHRTLRGTQDVVVRASGSRSSPLAETTIPAPAAATTLRDVRFTVSVAVCTAGHDVGRVELALRSVFRHAGDSVPVVLVDQGLPAGALPWLRECARVRHVVDAGRGASRARNIALRTATTDIVVFTDDDCEMTATTVPGLTAAFEHVPNVAIAFGSVTAIENTNDEGFIPTYTPSRPRILRGPGGKLHDGGIGACMALDREAALHVGGFDERFGPGTAPLPACEEGELAYRLLLSGRALAHCPSAAVVHHGRRPWDSGRGYAYQTFKATAASYAMHAWRGDPSAALLVLQQFGLAFRNSIGSLRRRRSAGLARFAGLVAGVVAGARLRPIRSGSPDAPPSSGRSS